MVEAVLHVLAELTPQALAEALAHEHTDGQQQHRLRAQVLKQMDPEVTAVERRYKAVDPVNNLVFHQAEREYEEVLRRRDQLQLAHARDPLPAVAPLASIRRRASRKGCRCPQLVAACSNHERERKELLRALLERVTCTKKLLAYWTSRCIGTEVL